MIFSTKDNYHLFYYKQINIITFIKVISDVADLSRA